MAGFLELSDVFLQNRELGRWEGPGKEALADIVDGLLRDRNIIIVHTLSLSMALTYKRGTYRRVMALVGTSFLLLKNRYFSIIILSTEYRRMMKSHRTTNERYHGSFLGVALLFLCLKEIQKKYRLLPFCNFTFLCFCCII